MNIINSHTYKNLYPPEKTCALPTCRICQKPPQNATSRSHQRKSCVQGKLPIWPFLSTWSTRGILAGILRSMKLAGGDFGEIALRFAPNNFWETDDVIRSIVPIVNVDFFLTYCDIMPIYIFLWFTYVYIYICQCVIDYRLWFAKCNLGTWMSSCNNRLVCGS